MKEAKRTVESEEEENGVDKSHGIGRRRVLRVMSWTTNPDIKWTTNPEINMSQADMRHGTPAS